MTYAPAPPGLSRMLMVIPWLIRQKEVPLAEMERRFSINLKQLVRDMEDLNEVDFFVSPEQRFTLEITGMKVRVLETPNFPGTPGLLPYEALACLVAARGALQISPEASDLKSAADKLQRAILPDAAEALGILPGAVAPPWLGRLRDWTMNRQVIRMRYRSTDKGELSIREVEPWRVYRWMGVWYLWGHSRTKNEPRRYRVDGIQRAGPTGDTFRLPRRVPPPPTTYRPSPDDHRVVFSIRPDGRWIMDLYSMRTISEEDDGTVRAEFFTRDPRVAARLSLRMGPHMEILEGAAARQALGELAAEVLACYEGQG